MARAADVKLWIARGGPLSGLSVWSDVRQWGISRLNTVIPFQLSYMNTYMTTSV